MIPKEIVQLTEAVKKIVTPLTNELGITNFNYTRRYKDNSEILLTTDPDWHDYLYRELHYIQAVPNFDSSVAECVIWDYRQNQEYKTLTNDGTEKHLNRFHIMNMITNQINYVETFGFSTTKENHIINYYYENAKDIFYRFKFYFLDKASNIIKIAENNRMIFPYVEKRNDSTPEGVIGIKSKLIKVMDIKKLHICDIRGENVVITKKELECIKWMMLGKSSSEIAMIMGVSLTTVNTHIKNIKVKIGLFKIGQLIKFFCKNQFDCLYS